MEGAEMADKVDCHNGSSGEQIGPQKLLGLFSDTLFQTDCLKTVAADHKQDGNGCGSKGKNSRQRKYEDFQKAMTS